MSVEINIHASGDDVVIPSLIASQIGIEPDIVILISVLGERLNEYGVDFDPNCFLTALERTMTKMENDGR